MKMDGKSEAEKDFMIKLVIENFDLSCIQSKFIATLITTGSSFKNSLFTQKP